MLKIMVVEALALKSGRHFDDNSVTSKLREAGEVAYEDAHVAE